MILEIGTILEIAGGFLLANYIVMLLNTVVPIIWDWLESHWQELVGWAVGLFIIAALIRTYIQST